MPTIARFIKIIALCFTIWLFEPTTVNAQNYQHNFAMHLRANDLTAEFEQYLQQFENTNDTAALNLGLLYFSNKKFAAAQSVLGKIPAQSTHFGKAYYYQLLCALCLNQPIKIDYFLINNDSVASNLLHDFFVAGNAMCLFDTIPAYALQNTYNTIYVAEQPLKLFKSAASNVGSYKHKSKWLAATYSAIVPGTGKWYAGYPLEALSAFIQIGALGGIFAENLIRSGSITSTRSIVFGGIFTLFHAGNVYASYHVVNKKHRLIKSKTNEEVTTALHMLLRGVYRD